MGSEESKLVADSLPRENESDDDKNNPEDAFRYVSEIAHEHLTAVMKERPVPGPHLSYSESAGSESQPSARGTLDIVQRLLPIFERESEPLLFLLVMVASQVQLTLPVEVSQGATLFFERIDELLADSNNESCKEFIGSVLEALLRRHDAKFVPQEDDGPVSWGLVISLGERRLDVSFDDVLNCFWTDWLDTDCHWCHKPFAADTPPIRTMSAETALESSTNTRIRIHNRHWACLEPSGARARFVPISHVWDPAIRTAHESRLFHADAATTIISTIHFLLLSAKGKYPPTTEFWHDYVSVPQWRPQTQSALLLALPAVYSTAPEILIHLADVPTRHVAQILVQSQTPWDSASPLHACLQMMTPLRSLYRSAWMERMWVTLELAKSRGASVLDASGFVWRTVGAEDTFFSRNSFGLLTKAAGRIAGDMLPHAPAFGYSLMLNNPLSNLIEAESALNLSLGPALELLRRKKCQYARDRILAAHIMTTSTVEPGSSADMPTTEADIYCWVVRAALLRGDCSPLLFYPEKRQGEDTDSAPEMPSWLFSGVSAQFDLGNEIYRPAPESLDMVIDGSAVKLKMDYIGVIEDTRHVDMKTTELSVVDKVVSLLAMPINNSGELLPFEMFVDSLNGIFPLLFGHAVIDNLPATLEAFQANPESMQSHSTTPSLGMGTMNTSFHGLSKRDPGNLVRLEEICTRYRSAPYGTAGQEQRDAAVAAITDILELKRTLPLNHEGPVNRLVLSAGMAENRRQHGENRGEPICRVKCPSCSACFWLRLDLRPGTMHGTKIYRFAGLTYTAAVEKGVGLVIQDDRIVGRMLYGAPDCGCQVREVVRIR